jgi:DNA-binding beta-propeller fold protein YncE/4-amino-4-deoxy-L-arabinose transferase-like glycosyltransferase
MMNLGTISARWRRAAFLGTALVLAIVAQGFLDQRDHLREALILYLLAMLLAALSAIGTKWEAWDLPLSRRAELVLIVLILVVGWGARLYRIDAMPPGAFLDEAVNGLEAAEIAEKNVHPLWSYALSGRPTLHLHFIALLFKISDVNLFVMRLVSIVAGLVTLVMVYLLAREAFDRRVALLAMALLAVTRWHINYSRIAFEAILSPCFALCTFYFLIKARRTGRLVLYAASGASLALGLYTYVSFRLMPIVLAAYALVLLVAGRWGFVRRTWKGWLLWGLVFLVVVAPLGRFAWENQDAFLGRFREISVFRVMEEQGSNRPLWENIVKHLAMFNYKGDTCGRHNVPGLAMLGAPLGILFALGIGLALWRWRRPEVLLLLVWLFVNLWAGILTVPSETPHGTRTIANVPIVALIAALFLAEVWAVAEGLLKRQPQLVHLVVAGVVLIVAAVELDTYFGQQANHPEVWSAFNGNDSAIARFINEISPDHEIYLSPIYYHFPSDSVIKFIAYHNQQAHQPFNYTDHLPAKGAEKDVAYILEGQQLVLLPYFLKYYPDGVYLEHRDPIGRPMFSSYIVTQDEVEGIQGLAAHYYANDDWAGEPTLSRQDMTIDFDWRGSGAPLPLPFSVEWRGTLYVPQHGRYTLLLVGPGQTEITLDDEPVGSEPLNLAKGLHSLVVRYQAVGDDRGWLVWGESGSQPEPVPLQSLYAFETPVEGLEAAYYANDSFQGPPVSVQIDPVIYANNVLTAAYSIDWHGKLYAPEDGTYRLGTLSDDGSYVYVDGQLVVDNGGIHGAIYREGSIDLGRGYHDIQVKYYESFGGKAMVLYWTRPGRGREEIPSGFLCYQPSAEIPQVAVSTPPPPPAETAIVSQPEDVAVPTPVAGQFPESGFLEPLVVWGGEGKGDGQFIYPRDVAVDGAGSVYVVDYGNRRIEKFAANGRLLTQWGAAGASTGILDRLFGRGGQQEEGFKALFALDVDPQGRLVALDSEEGAIWRFSGEGRPIEKIDLSPVGLFGPRDLAVGSEGETYVVDTGGSRLVKLDAAGKFITAWGSRGTAPGQFVEPSGVAIDGDGNVLVADASNGRVQKFDPTGKVLALWPITGQGGADGSRIAVSSDGRIFVTDSHNNRVLELNADGQVVRIWGRGGINDGEFSLPTGITVDAQGNVYVADTGNHRVQKFAPGQ